MSFERFGRTYKGGYSSPQQLQQKAGVYLVFINDGPILDVGEAGNVVERLLYHDRADQWKRNCPHGKILQFAATYILNEEERRSLETDIRRQVTPPCGDR